CQAHSEPASPAPTTVTASFMNAAILPAARRARFPGRDRNHEPDRRQPRRERGDLVVHEAARETRPLHVRPGVGEGELLQKGFLRKHDPERPRGSEPALEVPEEGAERSLRRHLRHQPLPGARRPPLDPIYERTEDLAQRFPELGGFAARIGRAVAGKREFLPGRFHEKLNLTQIIEWQPDPQCGKWRPDPQCFAKISIPTSTSTGSIGSRSSRRRSASGASGTATSSR